MMEASTRPKCYKSGAASQPCRALWLRALQVPSGCRPTPVNPDLH